MRASQGRPVFVLAPPAPGEDSPELVKEGIARRRMLSFGHACPCGAIVQVPHRIRAGEVVHAKVEHEPDCPAVDPDTVEYLRGLGWPA
jgi:hypothetical protein